MPDLNQHPIILKYIEFNNFGRLIGMDFQILEAGKVEYKLKIKKQHLATLHAAHGGLISALMDATVGVGALSAVCQEENLVSTVEMKLTFLNPALLNDELIATSILLKKGNRLLFCEGEIKNQKGEIVAKSSATLNAYPISKIL